MGRIIPSKLVWGAVAVALLAGLSAPRVAQAGCGDYVLIHGKHVPMLHSADQSDAAQISSHGGTGEGASNESIPERAPCHGPGCSNGSLPPAAPASEIHLPVDRWAIARGEGTALNLSTTPLPVEPSELCADGLGLSILRPPR